MADQPTCGRLTPHYSHPMGKDPANRCPGVRNPPRTPGYDGPEGTEWPGGKARSAAAIPDAGHMANEDSPLPCRCYFVNGHRITNDCTADHAGSEGVPRMTTAEFVDLSHRFHELPERVRLSIGSECFGWLGGTAICGDHHAAVYMREKVTQAEQGNL